MMARRGEHGLAGCVVAVSVALWACAYPVQAQEDQRITTLDCVQGQDMRLDATTGSSMMVLLPPGEVIRQVTIDNESAFHVALTGGHDGVMIDAMKVARDVHLRVTGQRGDYAFLLSAQTARISPYVVRLVPVGATLAAVPAKPSSGTYRLSGDPNLRPSSIRDDGEKIYIQWAPDQPVPIVLSVNRQGKEEMTDGYMRGDSFTLDRLYERLVFRIDKAQAFALRTARKVEP